MEILSRTQSTTEKPIEIKERWFLHYSVDPRVNHLVFVTKKENDSHSACNYLGTWGQVMETLEVMATAAEVLEERYAMEEDRRSESGLKSE